jgi:sigma-E factor negative regulatory protein RseC
MIEHRGIVQRIEGGKVFVAIEVAGCTSGGQSGACGIGQMASGLPVTLLSLPVGTNIKVGDMVMVGLPASRVTLSALLGYLFPAIAMIVGAWFGAVSDGTDGATALGGISGFLASLVLARVAIALVPSLLPSPQLISATNQSHVSQQEYHHER